MTTDELRTTQGDMDSEMSFDSSGKRKSFRRLITRFAEKTSMQGPPYINMAKFWWAKLIWATLLLGAVAVMVLHLVYLFAQWYSWPKSTIISLGFDDLPFPQVTICNTNVLLGKRFNKFKGAPELRMLVDDLKPENFVPHQFNENYDPENTGSKQGTSKPDTDQQNKTQQNENQQKGTQAGDNQQDRTTQGQQQNNNHQPPDHGTGQDGSQPPVNGEIVPGPTQPSPNEQEVTQSQSFGNTTREKRTRPGQTLSHASRTAASQPPPKNTGPTQTSDGAIPPSDGGKGEPNSRKKRFDSNYDNLNVSKYYKDYKNYDEEAAGGRNDLDSPIDSQREIENVFRELYMNINKNNRQELGHQIEDMLIGCTFNGRTCSSDMFKLHQTAEYGNCWTLASDKFTAMKAGPGGGLTVILFLETNEYLKGLSTGYGTRIQFQELDTYPFPFDEGVFISGAMETDIGLKLRTISRLGGYYGTCNDGVEFRKLYNLTYTRRACQAFCRITSVIKTCNCFDDSWEEHAFREDKTLKPCRSEKEQTCRFGIFGKFRDGSLSCQCDNPCSEVDYVKSVSGRQWPTNEYARVLLDWVCERDPDTCRSLRKDINNIWAIKNNFLRLNIYYEDLNFEEIKETAQIELQQFLSDIGGAFGLWIGLSVLSLCEVIQLFIELFDYGVHKTVRGQQADTDRDDKNNPESSGVSEHYEKDAENKLPRIVFDPKDRFPRHMRDISPYREHTSYRGSDDSLSKRKRDHDFYRLSPNLGLSRDRPSLSSTPDLFSSDRGSDDRRHHRRKHGHGHDSPKRARRHEGPYDRYTDFRDDYGLGKRNMMY